MRVINKQSFKPVPPNTISVGGETGEFFYQEEPYVTGRDVYYIDTSRLSKNAALFLLTIIKKQLHNQSTFTSIMTASIINNTEFMLPINSNNLPDWKYMEAFMDKIQSLASFKLNIVKNINVCSMSFNTLKWKIFKFSDLFAVKNSTNVLQRDITPDSGYTPYVTSSGVNNGVKTYIDASNLPTDKGNCLLIGGKTYIITYQKDDFVSNDSHNLIIRLKKSYTKFGTDNIYLFLVSVFRSYSYLYEWANAVNKDKLKSMSICLPADKHGLPDWEFMENFINQKRLLASNKIFDLRNVK